QTCALPIWGVDQHGAVVGETVRTDVRRSTAGRYPTPMMGRTHALTGWCAGLAVAPAVGITTLSQALVFAATTAGYALLPDLDHPGARASKLLGPVTGGLSWLLRNASRSEEHTSELQSRENLVCRLLLEN